ncbi:MAG: hypothetical protein J6B96_02665 [Agathobacter sp.]|nr:hypothetical protein [Agathobacter sp.]
MQQPRFRAFFPELLLNTLFSFILIAIIMQLLANAKFIEQDTALLKHAVSSCEEVAIFYNEEDGSFEHLAQHYPTAITVNHQLIIYLSQDFLYCNREAGAYYLLIEDNLDDTINIYFYEKDKDAIFSIERCVLKTEVPAS